MVLCEEVLPGKPTETVANPHLGPTMPEREQANVPASFASRRCAALQEPKTIKREWLLSPPLGIELSKEMIKTPPVVVRVKFTANSTLEVREAEQLSITNQASNLIINVCSKMKAHSSLPVTHLGTRVFAPIPGRHIWPPGGLELNEHWKKPSKTGLLCFGHSMIWQGSVGRGNMDGCSESTCHSGLVWFMIFPIQFILPVLSFGLWFPDRKVKQKDNIPNESLLVGASKGSLWKYLQHW